MKLVAVVGIVLVVVAVRELVRGRGRLRLRAMFDLTKQPVGETLAGLAAIYLAVAALAFTYIAIYGLPSGARHYAVGEVLPDGAAFGKLETGDRIERFDGEQLVLGDRSLVERVNAKGGAPFDLDILRRGERRTVRIEPKRQGDKWLIGIRPIVDQDRTRDGAVPFALGYPASHVVQLVRDIAHWARGGPEVGGVVRITEEFRESFGSIAIFQGALRLAGHAFVLFALLDLIRLALAFRDRLRA